jgi:hypothetical protein
MIADPEEHGECELWLKEKMQPYHLEAVSEDFTHPHRH